MSRYASADGGSINASREFKQMVKALHSAGIEVKLIFHCHKFGVEHALHFVWFCNILCHLKSYIPIHTQVILDVVYNHTNEVDDRNPYTTSFRGIDNKVISDF